MSGYRLSKRSLKELDGVHPILAFAVMQAIAITKQDFMVFDGLRTPEEQAKLVAKGSSKTNNSCHLYGLAVDLVAFVDGKPSWEERYYAGIRAAMQEIISRYDLPIEWGYAKWGWDMPHWQITTLEGRDAREVYDIRKIRGR